MCGIAGFLDISRQTGSETLRRMTSVLFHRGPDDSGLWTEEGIGLGHQRLSIIDLSPLGHQPMSNDTGSVWITYNGEIYNYRELRHQLEQNRIKFKSQTDTEVIIRLYESEGMSFLSKLIGMFAFVLWDKSKHKLFLVRDRVGVKPLYIYQKDGLVLFASELKALAQHPCFDKSIDADALFLYLLRGYIPAPKTIYKYCQKLMPGHFAEVDYNGQIKQVRYWSLNGSRQPMKDSKRIEEQLEALLVDSFAYRLVADVPVGLFLSGGIDSSCVAALLTQVKGVTPKTFTIGFEDPQFNEAPWALQVARHLQTEHTEHYVSESEALKMIPDIPYIYDEPFGDSSAIPTFIVSKLARQHVKVALSADGGDELFCGYDRYMKMKALASRVSRVPFAFRLLGADVISMMSNEWFDCSFKLARTLFPGLANRKRKRSSVMKLLSSLDLTDSYFSLFKEWSESEVAKMLSTTGSPQVNYVLTSGHFSSVIDQLMFIDIHSYLPDDLLVKVDRATMAVSLEGREPYLDHRLIEFAQSIPLELKLKNGTTKHILRSILYKYVPKELLERQKQGFSIPHKRWFQTALRPHIEGAIDELCGWDIFDRDVLGSIKQGPFDRHSLWLLYSLALWRRKWI